MKTTTTLKGLTTNHSESGLRTALAAVRTGGAVQLMGRYALSEAHATLLSFEEIAAETGNQNLGYLSRSHGLLPQQCPRQQLGVFHRAWDEVAHQLPSLFGACTLRRSLDQLPLLDASAGVLPAEDLARAALILALLAHSYVGADPHQPVTLPRSIQIPWTQVSARLGRPQPFLSYNDLIAYNWQFAAGAKTESRLVENLRLLVPTVDNEEEHRFYLTQVEILARSTPLITAVAQAHDAVLQHDITGLEAALTNLLGALITMSRATLPKIAPNAKHRSHVNPVIWARTVAPFAVPIDSTVPGPSGTSALVFHVLDVFLERTRYHSYLGKEALHLRKWFPQAHQAFLQAVAQVSITQFIYESGRAETRALLADIHEAYFGTNGFLGRHRRKVYGYLEIAFKAGRSHTIGGFSGTFSDREWDRVDQALECSRHERAPLSCPMSPSRVTPEPSPLPRLSLPTSCPQIMPSELLEHRSLSQGAWIKIGDGVYGLSSYLNSHVGGATVLQQYLGTDATTAFSKVGHATDERVLAQLEQYRIGTLGAGPDNTRYQSWLALGYFVTELFNSFEIEQEALKRRLIGHEKPMDNPVDEEPLRRELQERMLQRFLQTDIKSILVPTLMTLATESGLCPQAFPLIPDTLTQTSLENYLHQLHQCVVQVLRTLESSLPTLPARHRNNHLCQHTSLC